MRSVCQILNLARVWVQESLFSSHQVWNLQVETKPRNYVCHFDMCNIPDSRIG